MEAKLTALTTAIKYGPHLKTLGSGAVRYLKGQHFSGSAKLMDTNDSYADPASGDLSAALLKENQVIMAGKGNRQVAWAYRAGAGPCIASSLFYVLTVRTKLVDPRYLALVLNTASCGRALSAVAKGATVPVIPKRELGNLSVKIPAMPEQLKAIKLNDLQNRRKRLLREIAELNELLDGAHLEQLINQA
jgi:hypothetical protein